MSDIKLKKVLSVFALVMINVIAVDSIRTLPIAASFGLPVVTLYLLGAALFFIPTALITAELATTWPKNGGIYIWVREAFGPKVGLLVVYLQWIYNIVWYPTILTLVAGTVAYLVNPAWINDPIFMSAAVLVIFWSCTLLNCFGMRLSSAVSSTGSLLGTLLPMIVIIGLAAMWVMDGKPLAIELKAADLIPKISSLPELVFATAILYSLVGLEMSSVHASEVKNPSRDYPLALLISAGIILISLTLSSLAIALIVPKGELDIVVGIMQAFQSFSADLGMPQLSQGIALCIIIGGIGGVATWIIGPTKGLLAAKEDNLIPRVLQKTNRFGAPVPILICQAVIGSILTLTFLLMPTVKSAYWLLSAMATQLSLLMYAILFIAAIRLRYNRTNTPRPFKIPFGNIGIWVVAGMGCCTSVAVLLLGFVPPDSIDVGNLWVFETILIGGIIAILTPWCFTKSPSV
jgi:glutamate:GABA antiporter